MIAAMPLELTVGLWVLVWMIVIEGVRALVRGHLEAKERLARGQAYNRWMDAWMQSSQYKLCRGRWESHDVSHATHGKDCAADCNYTDGVHYCTPDCLARVHAFVESMQREFCERTGLRKPLDPETGK